MNYLPFVFFGGAIFVMVCIGVTAYLIEKKRRGDFAELAQQLGLEYREQGSPDIPDLNRFGLFQRGRSRTTFNILKGNVEGVRVAVFDYKFVTGSGKSTTTHKQTVCAIFNDQLNLPAFEMHPEGFWQKLGSLFGQQDIDFTENEAFSRCYVLRGKDEAGIRAVFNADVLAFFETRPGLYVEGHQDTLIFFRAERRLKVREIQDFLLNGIRGLVVFTAGKQA